MSDRYERNRNALTAEESALLHKKKVCVIGCGGLGGYVLEMLARIGVGHITCVDGDVFEVSNLNRQLLCTEALLGTSKVRAAENRLKTINSQVSVGAVNAFLTQDNCISIISGHDLIIDALDNIPSRVVLSEGCDELGISWVYGAIIGWFAYISVILPNTGAIQKLYPSKVMIRDQTSLSFSPALCASIQVSEAVKLLCGRDSTLKGKLLCADLSTQDFEVTPI
jgi:molybdopterin/thiamine biosynthesis adenylyltransferase